MLDTGSLSSAINLVIVVIVIFIVVTVFKSIYSIGPTQIGLVRKRLGAKLPGNNPVAFNGEAGYQAELLMPGLRFKFLPGLHGDKTSVGAGACGTDWRGDRAGGRADAHRRKIGRV